MPKSSQGQIATQTQFRAIDFIASGAFAIWLSPLEASIFQRNLKFIFDALEREQKNENEHYQDGGKEKEKSREMKGDEKPVR
jgi:hypothetical protein